MGVSGRLGRIVVGVGAFMMFLPMALFPQNSQRDDLLSGIASGKTRVLDLSYAINDKLVPWPGDTRWFEAQVNATVEKNGYFTRSFWMLEHYGTHLDAPIHFPPGKTTVDQIPAKQFFGPAVVLDVRAEGAKDADFQAPVSSVEAWEKKHGRILEGSIVLLRTGWASRWPDAEK
jgi:kynurenine formamidase